MIGSEIKTHRTLLNYSQKELAEKTGLTLRTIQRIEKNQVKPSIYSLKKISEVLSMDVSKYKSNLQNQTAEFNFSIKITDMNEFLNDLKSLILKHKKIILLIALVIYVLANYTEVKSGLLDGWNGN